MLPSAQYEKEIPASASGEPTSLALLGNALLRKAIAGNLVSFPSQIQPFLRRSSGDLQSRIVLLFFVRGWSVRSISTRYRLSKAMTHKLLAEWRLRAIESGCIQEIQPGSLKTLTATGCPLNDANPSPEWNGSHGNLTAVAREQEEEPILPETHTLPLQDAIALTAGGAR